MSKLPTIEEIIEQQTVSEFRKGMTKPDSLCNAADAIKLIDEAREAVFDCFNQACQVKFDHETDRAEYDHHCLSSYERAQDLLLKWGMIKEDQCQRK